METREIAAVIAAAAVREKGIALNEDGAHRVASFYHMLVTHLERPMVPVAKLRHSLALRIAANARDKP